MGDKICMLSKIADHLQCFLETKKSYQKIERKIQTQDLRHSTFLDCIKEKGNNDIDCLKDCNLKKNKKQKIGTHLTLVIKYNHNNRGYLQPNLHQQTMPVT